MLSITHSFIRESFELKVWMQYIQYNFHTWCYIFCLKWGVDKIWTYNPYDTWFQIDRLSFLALYLDSYVLIFSVFDSHCSFNFLALTFKSYYSTRVLSCFWSLLWSLLFTIWTFYNRTYNTYLKANLTSMIIYLTWFATFAYLMWQCNVAKKLYLN